MSERHESRTPVALMRASFRGRYERAARFREDGALAAELEQQAEPVLDALFTAFAPPSGPRALHEGYALHALLCRHAALLGATAGVPLAITDAICDALREAGATLDATLVAELAVVAVEGYAAARDERVTRELRERAAASQPVVKLGPGCAAVFLVGRHDEADLAPVLERISRQLLRDDVRSCLLDLSRLEPDDEELARAIVRFCALVETIGVTTFVSGASPLVRQSFERWALSEGATQIVDDFARAQALALGAVGLQLRRRRRWGRLLLPGRRNVVK